MNQLTVVKPDKYITKIGQDIKKELSESAVVLPKNYSYDNAIKAAYLMLLETKDRNKRPVLEVCSKESVYSSLLKMAVLGLNPLKKQCSFIAYGSVLTLSLEWPGAVAISKRVDPRIVNINAQPVYKGDKLKTKMVNGVRNIDHEEEDFFSSKKEEIIGAYAIAIDQNGNQLYSDIMRMEEIKMSWRQSKTQPVMESGKIKPDSTHGKFTEEMVRKTVINRLCKRIVRTSDDANLADDIEAIAEDRQADEYIQDQIEYSANTELLDFDPPETDDIVNADIDDATDDQCKAVYELIKNQGHKSTLFEILGNFTGRKITGLKQLTCLEADDFLKKFSPPAEDPDPAQEEPAQEEPATQTKRAKPKWAKG